MSHTPITDSLTQKLSSYGYGEAKLSALSAKLERDRAELVDALGRLCVLYFISEDKDALAHIENCQALIARIKGEA